MYDRDKKILRADISQATLFLIWFISLFAFAYPAQGQTPSGINSTSPNSGSISPNGLNNARPIRQQNFLIDSGSGSQEFFRQGGDQLYLLPEENSEPILKIDEATDTEKVDNEPLVHDNEPSPNNSDQ